MNLSKRILITFSFLLLVASLVSAAQINWYNPAGGLIHQEPCTDGRTNANDGNDINCIHTWYECTVEGDYWVQFDLQEEGGNIQDCRNDANPYTCSISADGYGYLMVKAHTINWDADQISCECHTENTAAWLDPSSFDSQTVPPTSSYGDWSDYPEIPDIYGKSTSNLPDTCDGDADGRYTCPDGTDQSCIDVYELGTGPGIDLFRSIECSANPEVPDIYGEQTSVGTDTCDGNPESRYTCPDGTGQSCIDVYDPRIHPSGPDRRYRTVECISIGTCQDTCPGNDNDNPYECGDEELTCRDCINSGTSGREVICHSGVTTSGNCCGDDLNEHLSERLAGVDSTLSNSDPADPDTACCNSGNKCVLDGICYSSGSTSGEIPDRNYCNEGIWQGGDDGEIQCAAIAGAGRWNIEGEVASGTCCGDDTTTEFYNYQRGGSINTEDFACCNIATDCVYNNQCYATGEREMIHDYMRYCVDGEWGADLKLKYDWNGENEEYCAEDSMCLTNQQECVNSGEFRDDHYCEDGEWTTRTKLVALQLFDIADRASADNFTLFCDSYKNTLNYYDYIIEGTATVESYFYEINNICVLKLPQQIIFGTSLNNRIDQGDFIKTLTGVTHCYDAFDVDGKYHQCNSGSSKAWYNNRTKSIIYSNKEILDNPPDFEIDAWQTFLRFLKNPFQVIFDTLFSLFEPDPEIVTGDYTFMQDTKDFSRIYFDRNDYRSIRGITEKVNHPTKGEYLSVTYSMYAEDICGTVKQAYNNFNPLLGSLVYCYFDRLERTHYVVSNHTAALALWPDLTAKLRTRTRPSPPMEYCHVRPSCESGENLILSLSSEFDAHASIEGQGTFTYKLCCPDNLELGSNTDEEALRLSSEIDAHADTPDTTDSQFTQPIYLRSNTQETLSCEPVVYPGSCYPSEICIITLSDRVDGHVSECSEDTKFKARVCCEVGGTPTVQGGQIDGNQICTDSDGGMDYNVQGTVTSTETPQGTTDYCTDQTQLVEYSCATDLTTNTESYTCPNGCQDGACIP